MFSNPRRVKDAAPYGMLYSPTPEIVGVGVPTTRCSFRTILKNSERGVALNITALFRALAAIAVYYKLIILDYKSGVQPLVNLQVVR